MTFFFFLEHCIVLVVRDKYSKGKYTEMCTRKVTELRHMMLRWLNCNIYEGITVIRILFRVNNIVLKAPF